VPSKPLQSQHLARPMEVAARSHRQSPRSETSSTPLASRHGTCMSSWLDSLFGLSKMAQKAMRAIFDTRFILQPAHVNVRGSMTSTAHYPRFLSPVGFNCSHDIFSFFLACRILPSMFGSAQAHLAFLTLPYLPRCAWSWGSRLRH
jgi:hypothetical protein